MEGFGGSGFANGGCTARKKRSILSRRPRPNSQTLLQNYTFLPPSTQPLGSGSNGGNRNSRDTMIGSDGLGSENKLKLKLKLGGITRTIQTKSTADYAFVGGPSVTKSFDAPQRQLKLLTQDDRDSNYSYHSDKGKGFGMGSKDFSKTVSSSRKELEPVRKSKRVPKRRVLDVGLSGDDDEDEEIRYLGKLNASRAAADYEDEEDEGSEREQRTLKLSDGRRLSDGKYFDGDGMEGHGSARLGKDGRKKLRSENICEDKDYTEEEEPTSDDELRFKRKKLGKVSDLFVEGRSESTPTTRNRTLQLGKDIFSGSAAGLIEFPNGLPIAPPKKQKEKLSELEQQLKKAEAAQRRRMQSEKAAQEAEAEAIRKILGQDSGRKKKEEKMKKQRDELAQVKAAKFDTLGSNTVRWVFGPTGTVVTFSEDIGLPNIFNSVPCSYPPPREKCAGPNCSNAYKYRDSKSKLPLCSLHCYRAIHGKVESLMAC